MQASGEQATLVSGRPCEDDMVEGDLGDGMGKKPGGLYGKMQQVLDGGKGDAVQATPPAMPRNKGSENGTGVFTWTSYGSLHSALQRDLVTAQPCPPRRLSGTVSLGYLSNEELKNRLQQVTEEAELLRCELEATQRHLEGKHEALKILQSQAMFDKATAHTKTLLQKSEERAKALEKEANALQWEITFNQAQFKNLEQSWKEKYERICAENKALSTTVEEGMKEVQELHSENSSLNQRCLELMAMLSAQEKRVFQGTVPPCSSLGRDGIALELAVLGACHCSATGGQPCPCARTAAASRKQVIQLKQEIELQRRRKEEAYVMADAFRIAFEQQLKRRSDHVLCLAEREGCFHKDVSSGHRKEGVMEKCTDGDPVSAPLKRSSNTMAQKIRGMLQSSAEGKISRDLAETLHHLVDLLNDKEEALAHQRKVSHMLARNTEELEQRLLQIKGLDCEVTSQRSRQELTVCDNPPSTLPFILNTLGGDSDAQIPTPTAGELSTKMGATAETETEADNGAMMKRSESFSGSKEHSRCKDC